MSALGWLAQRASLLLRDFSELTLRLDASLDPSAPGEALPAGPAEALHILERESSGWWTFFGVLLVPLLLGFLMQWLKGRSTDGVAPSSPRSKVVTPPLPSNALAKAIDALRDKTLADADFRAGCHRLGALLREHVGRRSSAGVFTWTVPEIAARLGDTPVSTVLGLLADLQFRRAEPEQAEFLDICQMARETATSGQASSAWGADR